VTDTDLIPAATRSALRNVALDLHDRYQGLFGQETIQDLLENSYLALAATATVSRWLVLSTERFARQRLTALAKIEGHPVSDGAPIVLFLCTHNAGRSQMALGWLTDLAGNKAVAWSGGSDPTSEMNPAAVAAMAEVGIDISAEFPKPWTDEIVRAADVVVTMGCGDACPIFPGKDYQDWDVPDPAGQTLDAVRPIRDQIGQRVRTLLQHLEVPVR
jgi:protein-tyrosine-phosphatase